jgi:hypothetical protein
MKKILMCVVAAALTGMTGRAAPAAKEAAPADPNAVHTYTKGMEATKENPSLALWQKDEAAAVAALTAPEALKAFVADEAAACGLLASVKPAYATDPLAAVQIAAVTQFVMRPDEDGWWTWLCFWAQDQADRRTVWTKALLQTIRTTKEDDVAVFCLDQLRWCGYPSQAMCVKTVTANRSTAVRSMAETVAREISR